MNKKIVGFLSLCFVFWEAAFGVVKQGTLSNGTPYYYNVSDGSSSSSGSSSGSSGSSSGNSGSSSSSGSSYNPSGSQSSEAETQKEQTEKEAAEQKAAEQKAAEEAKAAKEAAEAQAKKEAEEAIAAKKARAEASDKKFNEKLEAYLSARNELNNYASKLKNKWYVNSQSRKNAAEKLDELSKRSNQLYNESQKAADEMCEAYKALGEAYDKYGRAGDPVNIVTGDYIAEYEDYCAQDFGNKFTVQRNLINSDCSESFGLNWTCSLDSRIVRCGYEYYESDLEVYSELISKSKALLSFFDDYNAEYPDHPRVETEIFNSITQSDISFYEQEYAFEQERSAISKYLEEKNRYVCYGRYSSPSSYEGLEHNLKYLDENGLEYAFIYDSDGYWRSAGVLSAAKMVIRGLNSDGSYSSSDNTDGGYVVLYGDGHENKYSAYGILEKITDNNGNVTTFENESGRINRVHLKTGEILNITRNSSGFITSVKGNVSGESFYYYEGNKLTGVLDNSGILVRFAYNSNGNLTEILKADNSFVKLAYEFNSALQKDVCVSVTTETGAYESFSYYPSENKTVHVDMTGAEEVYVYNSEGSVVYVKDAYGKITEIETDENGLICAISENGFKRNIVYDELFRPVMITFADGNSCSVEYGIYGNITKVVDGDGFQKKYDYDQKGNLTAEWSGSEQITAFWYYDNGLLQGFSQKGLTTEYQYNCFGSVTAETQRSTDGTKIKLTWEYDSQNRIIKAVDAYGLVTDISYGAGRKTETFNGRRKTEHVFDCRNREVETVTSDLVTLVSYRKKMEYDGSSNLLRVYIEDQLYEEYVYDNNGSLIKKSTWNLEQPAFNNEKMMISEEISYASNGCVSQYVKNDGKTIEKLLFDYRKNGTDTEFSVTNQSGQVYTAIYDAANRLVKETFPDQSSRSLSYTTGGRIKYEKYSNFDLYSYSYNSDGSYSVTCQQNGLTEQRDYDAEDRLIRVKDFNGNIYTNSRNHSGALVCTVTPYNTVNYSYDLYGQLSAYKVLNKDNSLCESFSISYDYEKGTASVTHGGENWGQYIFDAWNRPVQITDKQGKNTIQYDALSNIAMIEDEYGNQVSYEYDVNGNLYSVLFSDGTFYCMDNLSVSEPPFYGYKNTSVNEEVNTEGKKINYDGYTIQKNGVEKVISISGPDCNLSYDYDESAQLVRYYDSDTLAEIEYSYDNFGRCIEKRSSDFDFRYSYDLAGRVQKIEDSVSKISLSYTYDSRDREILRKCSNGLEIRTSYNKEGLIESRICNNSIGQIISADFVLYDEKNRIKIYGNEKGEWNRFEYSSIGAVVKEERAFSQQLSQFYYNAAARCGIFSKSLLEEGENLYLTEEEFSALQTLIEKSGCNAQIQLSKSMSGWCQEYEYAENGNVKSEKNLYGKILYEYDEEGRLLAEHGENSNSGMNFAWDDEGNLTYLESPYEKLEIKYGKVNRPVEIKSYNLENSELNTLSYCYDPFGRRITETLNDEQVWRYVYDGLSHNLIQIVPVMQNATASSVYDGFVTGASNQAGNTNQSGGDQLRLQSDIQNQIETEYRWIDDSTYSANSGLRYEDFNKNEQTQLISNESDLNLEKRACSILTSGGAAAVKLYTDLASVTGVTAEFLIPDFRACTTAVCDADSNLLYDVSFDLWGNQITNQGGVYSFCQEKLSTIVPILNLGYRDYCPAMKCFTSLDPVKDGGNWFAFCAGDPLNFCDANGLFFVKIVQGQVMTNIDENVLLGNSTTEHVYSSGCYVTTIANIVVTMSELGCENVNEVYETIEGINDDKSLFAPGTGNLYTSKTITKCTGSSEIHHFTKRDYGTSGIKAELMKYSVINNVCAVAGVFDLRSYNPDVSNHMVAINSNFDETGHLVDKSSITGSSANDDKRLEDKKGYEAYNVNNLKELYIIDTDKTACGK